MMSFRERASTRWLSRAPEAEEARGQPGPEDPGSLEGHIHIKKALKFGATREEMSESIGIAIGVNAAAIVDLTDIAADNLDVKLY